MCSLYNKSGAETMFYADMIKELRIGGLDLIEFMCNKSNNLFEYFLKKFPDLITDHAYNKCTHYKLYDSISVMEKYDKDNTGSCYVYFPSAGWYPLPCFPLRCININKSSDKIRARFEYAITYLQVDEVRRAIDDFKKNTSW